MAPLIWALLACRDCPPVGEIPVRGGTDPERAEVAAELVRLEEALALPVCVDHVRIGGWADLTDHNGAYQRPTRVVSIEDDPEDPTALLEPLRHEVCHAVDYQNDVVKGREHLWLATWPVVGGNQFPPGHEPFAILCGYGPEALGPVWEGHEDELAGVHVLRQQVYRRWTPPPAFSWSPVVSVEASSLVEGDELFESASFTLLPSGALQLGLDVAGAWKTYYLAVDPYTGEQTGIEPIAPPPSSAGLPAPDRWTPDEGAVTSDGSALVRAVLELPSGSVERVHTLLDGEWTPAPAECDQGLFGLDDRLWCGRFEDGVVSWGYLIPAAAPAG